MNPYDFVPFDVHKPSKRQEPFFHHKFQGRGGQIVCQLTAETPIFIPEADASDPKPFITRNTLPIIPGSSLKGLLRNLVETVGNGCFLLFDESYEGRRIDYRNHLPKDFRKCRSIKELCIACRMFGMLERGEVFQGNVSVSDGVTETGQFTQHKPIYTQILMGPKPRHQAFYLRSHQSSGSKDSKPVIAGRKFYFHSPHQIRTAASKGAYNQHICPLDRGSRFTFTVEFHNLRDEELAVLLYALVLEPTLRHKIGLAKPLGLGSVKIEISSMALIDYQQRYTGQRAIEPMTVSECQTYVANAIAPFVNDTDSEVLQALRYVWRWDPADQTTYSYPGQGWFKTNPKNSIKETP